ncbi:hypothetical protein BDA99DRAFT_541967, partial [Phascolomyces articulosus]
MHASKVISICSLIIIVQYVLSWNKKCIHRFKSSIHHDTFIPDLIQLLLLPVACVKSIKHTCFFNHHGQHLCFPGSTRTWFFSPVDGDCQDLCSYFQLLKHTRFSGLCYVCIISWLALMILSCWFIM